jgi:hypothetical protein
VIAQCGGDLALQINPHDVALKLRNGVFDSCSDLVESIFIAVEPLLFEGAEEMFSKYQTTLNLMVSAGRCPGERNSDVDDCAKLTRKSSCEKAHVLWSRGSNKNSKNNNKTIDGTDRMCCGGEWCCANGSGGGASCEWYSHASILSDAIDRALRKSRCDLGNLLQPKTKKRNKKKKGNVSMSVRLRILEDPLLASFQCSGRIADIHMACVWYKGACQPSSAHGCHFCKDDEVVFT